MEQRVRRAPSRQVRYMRSRQVQYMRSRQVWYMPVGLRRCPPSQLRCMPLEVPRRRLSDRGVLLTL